MSNRVAGALAAVLGVVVLGGSAALLASSDYWGQTDAPLQWVIFIDELAASIALIVMLAREQGQPKRTQGIVLATGLLGASLFGTGAMQLIEGVRELGVTTPMPDLEDLANFADPLVFCFAVGLVVVLVRTKRWRLLWLASAALWGGLMLVIRLVGLGLSFM